jgi:hypothetical protein
MNNFSSYCGLVDARISASEKDLLVTNYQFVKRSQYPLYKAICKSQGVVLSETCYNWQSAL